MEVSGQAFVASAPAQEETRPLLGEKRDPLHDASLSSQTAAAGMRWHREGRWYTPHFLLAIWTTLVVVLRFDTPLEMPFTWYGLSSWVLVALIAAAALWGFRTSLGGRRLIEVPTVECFGGRLGSGEATIPESTRTSALPIETSRGEASSIS